MTAVRDVIVPGSIRTEVTVWESTYVTLLCGRCGHEVQARHDANTARCKNCYRVCQLGTAAEAGPNVIPFRPRRKTPAIRPAIA